jgi:hypothetical protein
MRTFLLTVIALLVAVPTSADNTATVETAQRIVLKPPTAWQLTAMRNALGSEFTEGSVGPSPPKLQVAEVNLRGKGDVDLVAVQNALCSNHACPFYFLIMDSNDKWRSVANIESWALPYVVNSSGNSMRDIIIFDHLTDDCAACSPPQPVRMTWLATPDREHGHYVSAGALTPQEAAKYKP